MGDEGGVLWGGYQSGGVVDRGWTSSCVVAGCPGRIWCQSLSATSAPRGSRDKHDKLLRLFTIESKIITLKLRAIESIWNTGSLCSHETPTCPSAPPEAKRSPALEKATVNTAP